MKRILSVIAMVAAVLFLMIGTGILFFQDALKSSYFIAEMITVYPISAVAQLILTGVPCTVLTAINLAGSHAENRGLSLLTCIYCSANLITYDFLFNLVSNAQAMIGGRMNGALYLANLSAVNSMFSQTGILANSALVFLLIVSVMQLKTAQTTDQD